MIAMFVSSRTVAVRRQEIRDADLLDLEVDAVLLGLHVCAGGRGLSGKRDPRSWTEANFRMDRSAAAPGRVPPASDLMEVISRVERK